LKILIIGSEGFIGSHCVTYFEAQRKEVFGVDLFERPSKSYAYTKVSRLSPDLDELFESELFDVVVNAAGSGNVPYSMSHPVIDFEANSLDTIRVLEAIRKHQPSCKYIHISSAAVYGNPARLPICEDDITSPLSPYGWHKLIAEQLCKEYSSIYSLNIAVIRPFSVYGVGLKKQLFWDIFVKVKNATKAIELHGTGQESRDFINVLDVVKAIDIIVDRGLLKGEIYNIGSGEETTIKEVVGIFLGQMKNPVDYRFNEIVRAGDPLNWRANIDRIKALGFTADQSLVHGLLDVAVWLQNSNPTP
jgi:UDP-glucose 4-epimerase